MCGKIIGYQLGGTRCFHGNESTIDSPYVDGVSVTHGFPRQHIWTLAAGYAEIATTSIKYLCPCSLTVSTEQGFHRLWETTISVTREPWSTMVKQLSFQMTPCGTDRGVVPIITAVPSTHHRGSTYNCLPPQLITLKSGFVQHIRGFVVLQLNL